ncbi:hypothetical protein ACVMB1_000254 [Bradyrhizobium sp. USDA 4504]
MGQAKPYDIPKRWVWEAYKRVKANRGAAGEDEQSIEVFEADLQSNLYKLWNRMSSGSYFPPPVKRVQIDKRDGGKRPLGIPTVSDRVAQAVVKGYLEPDLEKHFHPDCTAWPPQQSAVVALPGHARATPAADSQDRPPICRPVAKLTREEPDAGNPLVRVCEGCALQAR